MKTEVGQPWTDEKGEMQIKVDITLEHREVLIKFDDDALYNHLVSASGGDILGYLIRLVMEDMDERPQNPNSAA